MDSNYALIGVPISSDPFRRCCSSSYSE